MILKTTDNKWLWIIFMAFAIIFCDISLVNHYLFRTTSLDLGLYNHSIYDYVHFRTPSFVNAGKPFSNLLNDHFELYPLICSPLYFIFGSYSMLIVQIAMTLFGGYGIYKYVLAKTDNPYYSRLAVCHFFLIWGLFSALAYDYHNNVVAVMFVPWLFYYFEKGSFIKAGLFLFLILIGKENMALWMTFVGVGMATLYFKDKGKLRFSLLMAFASLTYFVVILKGIMPHLGKEGYEYSHFQFSALGNNFSEAIGTIFTRPVFTMKTLFTNHLAQAQFDGVKALTHIFIILSGGFIFFLPPAISDYAIAYIRPENV